MASRTCPECGALRIKLAAVRGWAQDVRAVLEGFDFIGIEREPEYVEIARARVEWWSQRQGETKEILKRSKKKPKDESQGSLL